MAQENAPAADVQVYKPGSDITAPKPLFMPIANYSEKARKKKIQGVVVLTLVVGTDGKPRDLKITKSLCYGLDEEAVKSVSTWSFEPAVRKSDGQAVPVQVSVETSFHLYRR